MSPRIARRFVLLSCITLLATCARGVSAGNRFVVTVPDARLERPASGRVIVFLVGPNRELIDGARPAEWDYLHDPMPVYATHVKDLRGGASVDIDAAADFFKTPFDELPRGTWQAQAVFDFHDEASAWQMEPGNLVSPVVEFEVTGNADETVAIPLSDVVEAPSFAGTGAELVEVRSTLLSAFRGREVVLRAGVVLPVGYKPTDRYAAVYEIPGFGGTHAEAIRAADEQAKLKERPATDGRKLAQRSMRIFLDPESPNGHTLFADSEVNGPCARALVEELIPAIEAKYPQLIAEPWARLLTGHSSGGWSACWLQLEYPHVFGGTWATSPDPIDFRNFERVNLYDNESVYTTNPDAKGRRREIPSVRDEHGRITMRVREEIAWEETIGPDNTGGQQWQSWQAVFGLPREDGRPRRLFDLNTGVIDRGLLEHYRKYDLSERLRSDPRRYGRIWRERIRLIVGDADDYYLNDAVASFADRLNALLPPATNPATQPNLRGYIRIVGTRTHDTIHESGERRAFDREMLQAIEAAGKN